MEKSSGINDKSNFTIKINFPRRVFTREEYHQNFYNAGDTKCVAIVEDEYAGYVSGNYLTYTECSEIDQQTLATAFYSPYE